MEGKIKENRNRLRKGNKRDLFQRRKCRVEAGKRKRTKLPDSPLSLKSTSGVNRKIARITPTRSIKAVEKKQTKRRKRKR